MMTIKKLTISSILVLLLSGQALCQYTILWEEEYCNEDIVTSIPFNFRVFDDDLLFTGHTSKPDFDVLFLFMDGRSGEVESFLEYDGGLLQDDKFENIISFENRELKAVVSKAFNPAQENLNGSTFSLLRYNLNDSSSSETGPPQNRQPNNFVIDCIENTLKPYCLIALRDSLGLNVGEYEIVNVLTAEVLYRYEGDILLRNLTFDENSNTVYGTGLLAGSDSMAFVKIVNDELEETVSDYRAVDYFPIVRLSNSNAYFGDFFKGNALTKVSVSTGVINWVYSDFQPLLQEETVDRVTHIIEIEDFGIIYGGRYTVDSMYAVPFVNLLDQSGTLKQRIFPLGQNVDQDLSLRLNDIAFNDGVIYTSTSIYDISQRTSILQFSAFDELGDVIWTNDLEALTNKPPSSKIEIVGNDIYWVSQLSTQDANCTVFKKILKEPTSVVFEDENPDGEIDFIGDVFKLKSKYQGQLNGFLCNAIGQVVSRVSFTYLGEGYVSGAVEVPIAGVYYLTVRTEKGNTVKPVFIN